MIDRKGELIIRITGFKGNLPLSPENYDIKELQTLLPYIEDILYPINKKDRPLITYHLSEGSITNQFKTGIQAIIAINAVFGHIVEERSIDFLDLKSATAIEFIQKLSYEKNYTFSLATSLKGSVQLDITPETKFIRSPVYDETYMLGLIKKAKPHWKGVNTNEWLEDLRGGFERFPSMSRDNHHRVRRQVYTKSEL